MPEAVESRLYPDDRTVESRAALSVVKYAQWRPMRDENTRALENRVVQSVALSLVGHSESPVLSW
jgi:hypothetical protein